MAATIEKVLVIGMGKVGSLVGTLLHETGFQVTGMDAAEPQGLAFSVIKGDVKNPESLGASLKEVDAVVSCLPYDLNINVAHAAHAAGIHYFDLTEDVPTTKAILELSETSKGLMAPQCGLAPGFIGIVGSHLTKAFTKIRAINLRVGALPQNPTGLLGYAFNWSPAGVVNEYLNDCEVIKDGKIMAVPAMEDNETIFINGLHLEAFTTSGGLGTMCETYEG
ncbi:MAG: L-lysine dehydrogenase, partial [Deltaproteobacteria bacterium]|nr:L-lysine dehydrogenase [Deltaproteobacteria bacterium]